MTQQGASLRWTLIWQLSIVLTSVVAAVIVGLCFYGKRVLSPNVALEHRLTAAIAESIKLGPRRNIEIQDRPSLTSLKQENKNLWYVIVTTDSRSVSFGAIPPVYLDVARNVHLFHDADLRGVDGTDEIASIEEFDTPAGEMRMLFGGNSGNDSVLVTLIKEVRRIYVPLLALALPAIFLSVPRIVRRALTGLSDVVGKAMEIELRSQGARLPTEAVPREVVPLVAAFNGVLERLEREFQKRQRFLVDAAHELRTPIAIMQTRIEGMEYGQDRERLLQDVARLGETAEQLLDFERNDQNRENYGTVDLVDIARTVVADLAPLAIAAGYEISFLREIDGLERQGNRPALVRAITNLVRNAIEHGGNRGMISVSVTADGQITVADQGQGISLDQQELVFEPFYRTTPRSTGAGLGLALVRQIVTNHGGHVAVDSGSHGTMFRIQM
ncbi:sensor histidine kinase [Mesorhizobium sp. BR1-1-2]|uniref:sensor histidine kinase n=2 Tax=unclassified Mesorhizobium TaxID=325217 RepID=UPI001CCD6F32|nr:HAMP domain-containing sensor histidine kinase [Mesorhizobium sp. BR1-1-2]MBZ9966980.1 HAMP domain-containing histidine kinase [Mesorhizobium sp. BR1-1-2]